MSMAFNIIKRACALKVTEDGLTDGEALFRAVFNYNPHLADKIMENLCDPRVNIDKCILYLVDYFDAGTP